MSHAEFEVVFPSITDEPSAAEFVEGDQSDPDNFDDLMPQPPDRCIGCHRFQDAQELVGAIAADNHVSWANMRVDRILEDQFTPASHKQERDIQVIDQGAALRVEGDRIIASGVKARVEAAAEDCPGIVSQRRISLGGLRRINECGAPPETITEAER